MLKKVLSKIFNPPQEIFIFKIYMYWFLLLIGVFMFFQGRISSEYSTLLMILFASGLFILRFLRGNIYLYKKHIYLLITFLVILCISTIYSINIYKSILGLVLFLSVFIIFVLTFDIFSNTKIIKWFLAWLLFLGSIFSIFGIYLYFTGASSNFISTFSNSFESVSFLLLIIPISFYFYISSKNLYLKTINLFTLSLLYISSVLAFNYFGYGVILLETLLLIILFRRYIYKDILKFILLIFVVGIFSFIFIHFHKPQVLLNSSNLSNVINLTQNQRVSLYKKEISIMFNKPFFGYGLSTFSNVFKKFQYAPWLYLKNSFSTYMSIFIDTGILGGLAVFIFIISFIYNAWFSIKENLKYFKYTKNIPNNLVYFPLYISIFSIFVYAIFYDILFLVPIMSLLFILIGISFRNFKTEDILSIRLSNSILILSLILFIFGIFLFLSTTFFNDGTKILSNVNLNKSEIITSKGYFKNSISFLPINSNSYYEMGLIDESLKNYKGAVNNLDLSLKYNNFSPKIYYELGKIYFNTHKYKKSLYYFKKAYNFNRYYSPNYILGLGEFYMYRKNPILEKSIYLQAINKYFPLNKFHKKYNNVFFNNNMNNIVDQMYINLFNLTKNKKYIEESSSLSSISIFAPHIKKK